MISLTNILLLIIILTVWSLLVKDFMSSRITKKKVLKYKIRDVMTGIRDKEIEIEISWRLLRLAEKKRDKVIELIEQKRLEMEEERAKTPCDMDKVRALNKQVIELGWTGEKKDGKTIYKGKAQSFDSEAEGFRAKIEKDVMQREYGKMQLAGIKKLEKEGWTSDKDFERFFNEQMPDIAKIKPVLAE